MKKIPLYNKLKKWLFLGTVFSVATLSISCSKNVEINEETNIELLNEMAKNIDANYENKHNVNISETKKDDIKFTNFNSDLYEIIEFNINNKNKETNTMEISFKLRNKDNNQTSNLIKKTISDFKKEENLTNQNINDLASKVKVNYENKNNITVDLAQLNDLTFANYDENLFEIVEKNIVKRNETEKSIGVTFKLKNKTNNEISSQISKTVLGFKDKMVSDDLMNKDETVSIPGDDKKDKINVTKIQKYNLKVGHWNILNYGAGRSKTSIDREKYQATAISEIIFKKEIDLIGLTEINYEKAENVQQIVDLLNQLQNGDEIWKYVFQPATDTNPAISNRSVYEQIAIVYKSNVFKPVEFDDNKKGSSFVGNFSTIQNEETKRGYVRPLYGHKFEHINSKKGFTFIFGHFDSPDARRNSDEKIVTNFRYENNEYNLANSQGNFEATEAINLAKALEYFDKIDGDSTIMFAGDTNIKYGNKSLFQPSIDIGYKLLYGDDKIEGNDKYATSLKRPRSGEPWIKGDSYSQPFDRIIFKEANGVDVVDESEDPNLKFKVDIVNAFNKGLLDLEKYKQLFYRTPSNNAQPFTYVNYINSISDHVMVFANIIVTA